MPVCWAAAILLTVMTDLPRAAEVTKKPSAPQLEEDVRQLVADLDAATRAKRSAAELRLLELGPAVLPFLPAPELLPSFSVRETVQKVRFQLERRKARESVLAARVNLRGRKPLTAWLTELARQSGNLLDGSNLPVGVQQQELEMESPDGSFWPVLDSLSAKARVQYRFDTTSGALKLIPIDAQDRAPSVVVAYDEAFRVTAAPAQVRELFGVKDHQLWRVPLTIITEPRLRPLFLKYAAADLIGRTADDRPLEPLNPAARYELALGEGGREARMQLDFRVPVAETGRSLSLTGKLNVTLAAGSEKIRFTNLSRLLGQREAGIAKRRGGVTVTLNRAALRKSSAEGGEQELLVNVAVTYDTGGPAFESHRSWMLHNEVHLEGPRGERIALNGGFDTTLQADGAIGLEYRFKDLPAPLPDFAFVYSAPTLIVDVPVAFELKSVPVERGDLK